MIHDSQEHYDTITTLCGPTLRHWDFRICFYASESFIMELYFFFHYVIVNPERHSGVSVQVLTDSPPSHNTSLCCNQFTLVFTKETYVIVSTPSKRRTQL